MDAANLTSEEIRTKMSSGRTQSLAWMKNAQNAINVRNTPLKLNRFQQMAQAYGQKHIYTGKATPVFHMMMIVGVVGYGIEYYAHQKFGGHGEDHH